MLWFSDLRQALESAGGAAPPPASAVAAYDYVPELGALCLCLSSGEILLLDTTAAGHATAGGGAAVEEVGAVDGGVAAAAWSPDGELLAVASGAASLLLMNKVRAMLGSLACTWRVLLGRAQACPERMQGGQAGRHRDGGWAMGPHLPMPSTTAHPHNTELGAAGGGAAAAAQRGAAERGPGCSRSGDSRSGDSRSAG